MERFAQLLLASDALIADVAEQVGINNPKNFPPIQSFEESLSQWISERVPDKELPADLIRYKQHGIR